METQNAAYWYVVTPLGKHLILHGGYPFTLDGIIRCKEAACDLWNRGYAVSVVLLDTIEYELPNDDTEYDCSNDFYSKRLCIIIYSV